jgi:dTDP-D-glucose 4,6-dehydratase
MAILVTSGSGFISSNLLPDWLGLSESPVVNFDKPASRAMLNFIAKSYVDRYVNSSESFIQINVVDASTAHRPISASACETTPYSRLNGLRLSLRSF